MKLEVRGLSSAYKSVKIIDNINFKVEEGEFFTILGDSGSGKSTILKSISGLMDILKGQIILNNKDITSIPTEKRNISFVFQNPLLFPHLSVGENISFGLKVKKWRKLKITKRIEELVNILHIEGLEDRLPNELSGGQKQRVAIARALASNPSIILMDEPFSSLDPKLRNEMGQLLKEIQEKLKLTVIFVTHDPKEALTLSDKIGFLINGNFIQIARPNEIYYKPVNTFVGNFFGNCNYILGNINERIFKSEFCDIHLENISGEKNVLGEEAKKANAKLFIRPHQIEIIKAEGPFRIEKYRQIGKEKEIIVTNGKNNIIVETQNNLLYEVGERVDLKFPKENLHFLEI